MTPFYLKIKGLYSYQDEQEVFFDKLTEASLFGIFGAVGSGKSSILEAIVFALYGDTERLNSREDRTYNMMNLRSNDLLIEFVCTAGKDNEKYKFVVHGRRNGKNFKDVKTYERKAYQLMNDAWTPIQADDVAQKIIGLSYENFRRTVIIPQGRFQEFIELKGKERSEMMKVIFNLERYDLGEKVAILSQKNKEKLAIIDATLSTIGEISTDIIEQKEHDLKLKKVLIENAEIELVSLRKIEKKQEEIANVFKKLSENKNKLIALQSQENSFNARIKTLEIYEKCLLNYQAFIAQKNTQVIDYQRLKTEYDKNLLLLQTKKERFLGIQNEVEKVKPYYEKREEYNQKAKEYLSIIQLKNIELNASNLSKRIADGEAKIKENEQQNEVLKKTKIEKNNNLENLKSQKKKFDEQYDKKMAHLIVQHSLQKFSEELKNNEPCPLCGSIHHPNKLSSEENFNVQIEILRKEKNEFQAKIENLENEIKKNDLQIEALQELLNKKYLPILGKLKEEFAGNDGNKSNILENLKLLKIENFAEKTLDEITKLEQETKANYEKIIQKFELLDKENRQIDGEIKGLEGSIGTLKTSYENAQKNIDELNQKINLQLEKDNFESEDWVKDILKKQLNSELERKAIQEFQTNSQATLQTQKQLLDETEGKNYEAETHQKIISEIKDKDLIINNLRKEQGSLEQEITTQKQKLSTQKTLTEDKKKLEIRKENIDTLQKLFKANGFVDFVSSIYLTNLCNAANKRFHAMTRQQLHLEINESNDFEVRDLMNGGHTRLLKTLSGGQKFQAALSLALALADNIHLSTKSKQNFFFLDEGFGSLDKESLFTVFDTLKTLRKENRIVGIISHVEELQQEIDRYLLVKNDSEKGSLISLIE